MWDIKIKLIAEGYSFKIVPQNWFTKLVWRWISIDLKIEDTNTLFKNIQKEEWNKNM